MTKEVTEDKIEDNFIKEIIRFGTSKLHVVSAYLGGVAAQEAVKLIMS